MVQADNTDPPIRKDRIIGHDVLLICNVESHQHSSPPCKESKPEPSKPLNLSVSL